MNFKSIKKYQLFVLFCFVFSKKDNPLIRYLRSLYHKLKFSLWSINLTLNSVNLTQNLINPFSTNVPFMDKPGSWFLLAKCLKNTCGRLTFFTLPQVFFKHFTSKNQLPGFYITGTLVKNGLKAFKNLTSMINGHFDIWNVFMQKVLYETLPTAYAKLSYDQWNWLGYKIRDCRQVSREQEN